MCQCPSAETLCGEACVDLDENYGHCGGCDDSCETGQSCAGGECVCDDGRTNCGGTCVDVTVDDGHCGACDNICDRSETCIPGADLDTATCAAILYDFESGLDGWADGNPDETTLTSVSSSDARAFSGDRSLEVVAAISTDSQSVRVQAPSGLGPGAVIRYNVWTDRNVWFNSMIVHGDDYEWVSADPPPAPIPNEWTRWTQTVPDGLGEIHFIGVYVGPANNGTFEGAIYIDAIAWTPGG
jgi:hypothetical protein